VTITVSPLKRAKQKKGKENSGSTSAPAMFLRHRQAGQPVLRLTGLPAYGAKTH